MRKPSPCRCGVPTRPPLLSATKQWEAMMELMLADLEGSLPCSPPEVANVLKKLGWPPTMINNTMAYADGRKLFFRQGRWTRTRW